MIKRRRTYLRRLQIVCPAVTLPRGILGMVVQKVILLPCDILVEYNMPVVISIFVISSLTTLAVVPGLSDILVLYFMRHYFKAFFCFRLLFPASRIGCHLVHGRDLPNLLRLTVSFSQLCFAPLLYQFAFLNNGWKFIHINMVIFLNIYIYMCMLSKCTHFGK